MSYQIKVESKKVLFFLKFHLNYLVNLTIIILVLKIAFP
nr:MAG TPA: hypothetical protein [Crassvirales sp.]